MPPKLNPFGASVRAALHDEAARELSDSVIARFASADSDGDHFSNITEIKAGTLPGDPSSRPTGLPPSESGSSSIDRVIPRHSFHPLIVHFPVALLIFGAVLEAGGAIRGRAELRAAGFINISAASLFSLIAVATGLTALLRQSMPLVGIPLFHLCIGSTAAIAMALVTLQGIREQRRGLGRNSRLYWILLGLAFMAVAAAGHLGSMLVFG